MRTVLVLVFLLLSIVGFGQSGKKKKKNKKATEQSMPVPTSLDPNLPQEKYEPKKSSRSSKGPTYQSEQEYYERKAGLEKTRRKNERMLDKPQYSDPAYFGHKRPPKRRPPNKMKFCKVCGIRH
jgi:hypothetical protein